MSDEALRKYAADLFASEDEVLQWIQAEANRNEMPQISLQPEEGKMLQVFLQAAGARKGVEIGTLAGYSGTWIARALPADGQLYTLEVNPKHARVARSSFERAGVSDKVTIIEGAGRDSLSTVEVHAPFDFVFIDADRESYPTYFEWVDKVLRPGGLFAVHNAYANGRITAPESAADHGMATLQQTLASNDRYSAVISGLGDGMVIAVKLR